VECKKSVNLASFLKMRELKILSLLVLVLLTNVSCEPKDPAILKVFVRSASNQLINGAKVIVIGDQQSNPPTQEFVDTSYTNSSGFSVVDMDKFFRTVDNNTTTGYFDIIVKHNSKTGTGYTRCRVHTTSVETVYLLN